MACGPTAYRPRQRTERRTGNAKNEAAVSLAATHVTPRRLRCHEFQTIP